MEVLNVNELIQAVQVRSQQRDSNFLNKAEITSLLQSSIDFVYFAILDLEENFFLKTEILEKEQGSDDVVLFKTNTLGVIDPTVGLKSKFLRLELVECNEGNYWYPLKKVGIRVASKVKARRWGYNAYNNQHARFRLSFVPDTPKLVAPTQENPHPEPLVTNFPPETKNFIIFDATAQASDIEQMETMWSRYSSRWLKRILDTSVNRDTSSHLQKGRYNTSLARDAQDSGYEWGYSFYTLLSDRLQVF